MAITFIPKDNRKEIEVEGYGKIYVRPYGAGEELQIQANLREMDELQKEAESVLKEIKEKYGDDESKMPEDLKKKFEIIQKKVNRFAEELNEIIRNTISSEKKGVAERLYRELPMSEIRRMVQSLREEDAEIK